MESFYKIIIINLLRSTFIVSMESDRFDRFVSAVSPRAYSAGDLRLRLQFLNTGRDKSYDDLKYHSNNEFSCVRDCNAVDFRPKICVYELQFSQYKTFSMKCGDCPNIRMDCFKDGCITADGTKMKIFTVNRMLSGPAIHVCQGDRLVIDVENLLPGGRSLSVHWHGIRQLDWQFSDGVTLITQCPIHFGQKFRYEFVVPEAGTYFYHPSNNEQHIGGLAGPLIVRSRDPHDLEKNLYHHDLFSHTIIIQDLIYEQEPPSFPIADSRGTILSPNSYLINGRGHRTVKKRFRFSEKTKSPLAEFWVKERRKYRLRIISATNLACSIRLAIENHPMMVIAVDGDLVVPVTVGTIYLHAGERVDVVIETNQKVNSYWMRVQGNDFCSSARQSAVLIYEGAKKFMPSSKNSKKLFTQFNTLPDLNNFELGCLKPDKNLCWENLVARKTIPDELFDNSKVQSIEIEVGRMKLTNENVAQSPVSMQIFDTLYGQDHEEEKETFDHVACKLPPFPILTQPRDQLPNNLLCPPRGDRNFHECLRIINISLHRIVEIIFIDTTEKNLAEIGSRKKDAFSYDRSIHFHGYKVLVLKQGTAAELNPQNYREQYTLNKMKSHPIFKDTISIPKKGFTIVRFQATNPGIWILETPIVDGNYEGVALVFKVEEDEDGLWTNVRIPYDFPECNNYTPTINMLKEDLPPVQKEKEDSSSESESYSSSKDVSRDQNLITPSIQK